MDQAKRDLLACIKGNRLHTRRSKRDQRVHAMECAKAPKQRGRAKGGLPSQTRTCGARVLKGVHCASKRGASCAPHSRADPQKGRPPSSFPDPPGTLCSLPDQWAAVVRAESYIREKGGRMWQLNARAQTCRLQRHKGSNARSACYNHRNQRCLPTPGQGGMGKGNRLRRKGAERGALCQQERGKLCATLKG